MFSEYSMHHISILLGTYNGASFLSEQIDSVLNQSHSNWRLIIRDDGSTDTTKEILHDYRSKYPEKIMIVDSNGNLGVISNFSRLLESSQASYIMFCDQDDVWLPDKIELTLKKMQEIEKSNPNIPLLIHTDLKVVNRDLDILNDSYWGYQGIDPQYDTLNRLLVQNVITGCTVLINKKLADLTLPIPNEVIMHDWWLGLVATSFGQIHHINTPTMLYRQHANNDTGATSFNFKTILKKLQNLSNINLEKYTVQSELLLSRYSKDLRPEQKELLEAFIDTKNQSWLQSKQTLVKYKILKQGYIRNIGLFLC